MSQSEKWRFQLARASWPLKLIEVRPDLTKLTSKALVFDPHVTWQIR